MRLIQILAKLVMRNKGSSLKVTNSRGVVNVNFSHKIIPKGEMKAEKTSETLHTEYSTEKKKTKKIKPSTAYRSEKKNVENSNRLICWQ